MIEISVLLIWVIVAIAAGAVASKKSRNVAGWVIASLVLSPLVLIIILVLPNGEYSDGELILKGKFRKCPFCSEVIKIDAAICRYCSKELPPLPDETCRFCGVEVQDDSMVCSNGHVLRYSR